VVVVHSLRARPPEMAAPALPVESVRAMPPAPRVEAHWGWTAGAFLALVAVASLLVMRPARGRPRAPLSEGQRRAALQRLQNWMQAAEPAAETAPHRAGGLP
jgi:hypothetical protein